jgi:cytochrome P450
MARDIPSASLLEGLRFTLVGVLPNVLQGLFRRRPRIVALATRLDVDRRAVGAVAALRRRHGEGPLWVRVLTSRVLLLPSVDDVRRLLEGAPEPFAADPDAKRRGMSHFQPHALTISRGDLWRQRRELTEAVLDSGEPLHRLADSFLAVCREETEALLAEAGGELGWERFHAAMGRITRRIVLGNEAREDVEVSRLLATLMDEANRLPKQRSESFEPFVAELRAYAKSGEEGSLAGLLAEAPAEEETDPPGQLPHWMFAMHDTLSANALRALALIASHPLQRAEAEGELAAAGGKGALASAEAVAGLVYLEACLQEAMRLWPTTTLLSRETVEDTTLGGAPVPTGTQVLISNTFNHRDRDAHEFADRFAPEAWTDGDAAEDWSFNHFSHGPQGCPGAGIALFVGKAVLAALLAERRVRLAEPQLDPDRSLPHMLDPFQLRFTLTP